MKLIKFVVALWVAGWLLGTFVAFPGNVFFCAIALVGYLCVAATFGSGAYWKRYSKQLNEKRQKKISNK
jgi:hypothetical protein